jgi:hypothetical protein
MNRPGLEVKSPLNPLAGENSIEVDFVPVGGVPRGAVIEAVSKVVVVTLNNKTIIEPTRLL